MRRVLLAALLGCSFLSLPPSVHAGEPVSEEGTAASAYMDELDATVWQVGQALLSQSHEVYDVADAEALGRRITSAHALLVTAHAQASTWPAFRGDPAMRDAVATALRATDELYTRDLPNLVSVLTTEPPTSASDAALEASWRALQDRARRIDDDEFAAVQAFGRDHHLVVARSDISDPNPVAPFVAPEIVPPGSRVPDGLHAVVVVAYRNAVMHDYDRTLDGWDRITGLPPSDFAAVERARVAYVAALDDVIAHIRAIPDFRGEPSLRDAVAEGATAIREAMVGDFADYVRLASSGPLREPEHARAAAAIEGANDAVQGAQQRVLAAFGSFDARWKVAEYQAWFLAHRRSATPPAPASPD